MIDVSKITVATYKTSTKKAGTEFPACKNCCEILKGFDIITGRVK